MPRKPTYTPPASPIPGIIPEPVRVQTDPRPARGTRTPPSDCERSAAARPLWPKLPTGPITRARRR